MLSYKTSFCVSSLEAKMQERILIITLINRYNTQRHLMEPCQVFLKMFKIHIQTCAVTRLTVYGQHIVEDSFCSMKNPQRCLLVNRKHNKEHSIQVMTAWNIYKIIYIYTFTKVCFSLSVVIFNILFYITNWKSLFQCSSGRGFTSHSVQLSIATSNNPLVVNTIYLSSLCYTHVITSGKCQLN